jgi:hypothetical protein
MRGALVVGSNQISSSAVQAGMLKRVAFANHHQMRPPSSMSSSLATQA